MRRREFLASTGGALAWGAPAAAVINAGRLRRSLEELSVFGRPAGGTFADGVSRVAFSDADVAGRRYVMGEMRKAQLDPRIDPAGNIFARRAGTENSLPPVLFGSHIDSVPQGGNFDGDVGSLAAIEVIRALNEAKITTRRPLEIVVWTSEEGVAFGLGTFGSRIASGELGSEVLTTELRQALSKIGGDGSRIGEARRAKGSFHAYLELHIEQGPRLERLGLRAGVVEGIVAIDRYDVAVHGMANHAGTTPMAERKDALLGAARFIIAAHEEIRREEGTQVGNIGEIQVTPGAPNVVPGEARLTLEMRDLSTAKLDRIIGRIRARPEAAGVEIKLRNRTEPALAAPHLQALIEKHAAAMGIKAPRMPSFAGHDAASMAQLGPMGMIFIPSIGGISHSPREFSRWEDCATGAMLLLACVVELAG